MTNYTLWTLSLSLVALFASIFALSAARHSLALSRSSRLSGLLTRLQELEDTQEATSTAIKGLKARLSMQDLRARKGAKPDESPEVDADASAGAEFRRKMNAAIAAGQISALPRR